MTAVAAKCVVDKSPTRMPNTLAIEVEEHAAEDSPPLRLLLAVMRYLELGHAFNEQEEALKVLVVADDALPGLDGDELAASHHLLELQPLHARAPVEEAPRPLLLLGLEVDRALVAQQERHDD